MTQTWRRTVKADLTSDPLTLAVARDQHLRVTNGTAEDSWIIRAIRSSLGAAQKVTNRRHLHETWTVSCRFPCGSDRIVLDRATVRGVTSITYIDPDGVSRVWGGSPSVWELVNPSVESNERAAIVLGYDQEWPETRAQWNAVTITVELGYPDTADSPPVADVPDDIITGRLLMIGEMYKQRSESVHAVHNTPAMIRARDLWLRHKVY